MYCNYCSVVIWRPAEYGDGFGLGSRESGKACDISFKLTSLSIKVLLNYVISSNKLRDSKCWRFSIFFLKILAGSGDMKAVRLWDCRTEMKLTDFPSGTDSFVTRYINLPVKHSKL